MGKNILNLTNKEFSSEIKQIFMLSWPVMVGMILQSLLGTVDTYFISKLGTSEAAAAGLSNSASNVIFVMSTLVSAGTIALVSRSYGEGNMEAVKN
jgi:Na+-driven multidrug efflux pump